MSYKPDPTVATDSGKSFEPHPEGQHIAVCVDCINLGEKVEEYPGQPKKLVAKAALVWRSGLTREDGEYHEISKEFTLSTNERGNLRKFLTSWRGRSFSDAEAQRFELHTVVGVPALLMVEHKVSGSQRRYANIVSITRLPKGLEAPDVGEYTRAEFWEKRKKEYAEAAAKFRGDTATEAGSNDFPEALDEGDDDLPF